MKRVFALIVLFFSLSPAAGNGYAAESNGERILALSPHACEILYAIGAAERVVGAVDYCDYPQAATAIPRVANFNRINVEAALSLKPTMAIVMNEQQAGVAKLRALGVKIVTSYPKTVAEVLSDIGRIGLLTGYEQQAKQLVSSLQKRLDKVKQLSANKSQVSVFYETWSEPLLTAGNSSFIHDVLSQAGLKNIFAALALEAPRVNMESIIQARPQLIIIPSENRDISQRRSYWQKWLGKDVLVISVNPDLLHRPGPRLVDGMESLMKQLQGLNIEEQTFEE